MEPGNGGGDIEKGRCRGHRLMALLAAQRARRTVGAASLKLGPEVNAGPSAASEVEAPPQVATEVEAPPGVPASPEEKTEEEGGVNDASTVVAPRFAVEAIGSNAKTVNFYFFFKFKKQK